MFDLTEELKSLEETPNFVNCSGANNCKTGCYRHRTTGDEVRPNHRFTFYLYDVAKNVFLPKRFLKFTKDDIKEMFKKSSGFGTMKKSRTIP